MLTTTNSVNKLFCYSVMIWSHIVREIGLDD